MARARRDPGPGLFPEAQPPATSKGSADSKSRRTAPSRPLPVLSTGPFARVVVARPMRTEFSYKIPEEWIETTYVGVRVRVPFGRRSEVGVVVGIDESAAVEAARLRSIAEVLDEAPVVDSDLLALGRGMAERYACSWGEALAAMLPAALKRGRGRRKQLQVRAAPGVGALELAELEGKREKQHRLLRTLIDLAGPIEKAEVLRRLNLSDSPLTSLRRRGWVIFEEVEAPLEEALGPSAGGAESATPRMRPEHLSPEQEQAAQSIAAALDRNRAATFLLRGVTGSGKTEVYLRVIEDALAQGRGAIVLVPEIALTPQTVSWFRSRFEGVAVLHSRMTDAQRLSAWMRVKAGRARVVVGARSAIFAPVARLGVVVVDEEHEPSFKQASVPRYHGRDLAVVRAEQAGAVCILGSATPSLESWKHARAGRYELLELNTRVGGRALPPVEVIDMRAERSQRGPGGMFSRALREALESAFAAKQQSILFMNRRGFAPVLWCPACGETLRCEQCDVAMTFHRRIQRAVCHSCCEERVPPKACPSCTAPGVRLLGIGSERIQDALHTILPEARVARMDSDTMLRRQDYEETLESFGRGEIDILVGTQMIAKGLDFPGVTVVGIVSADSGLHLPDFRAAERTFQLLMQVAGRAGRGDLPGRILVQTHAPEHPSIVLAARHDFVAFAEVEQKLRAELGYPPEGRLIRVVLDDEDEARVRVAGDELAAALGQALQGDPAQVLGPAPAPIAKLRGRHRINLLVKAPAGEESLDRARRALVELTTPISRPRISIDVDPVGML